LRQPDAAPPRRRGELVGLPAVGQRQQEMEGGGMAAETRAGERRLDDMPAGLRGAPLAATSASATPSLIHSEAISAISGVAI